MAPVDPQQLLKALNELLGPSGGVLGTQEAVRIANLMQDAKKLVSKCTYVNILKSTSDKEVLEKLISTGAWKTLNDWLQESKEEDNFPFMVELLKVYKQLPVTVDILKTNSAAKTIKQMCKVENDEIKTRAKEIFDEWMKLVNNGNNNDSKSKKKKDKEKEHEKDDRRSSKDSKDSGNKSSSKSDKDKSRSSHHSSKHHRHESSSSKDRDHRDRKSSDKDRDKERTKLKHSENDDDAIETSSNDSSSSSSKTDATVRKGAGLKLHFKLGGEKVTNSEDTDRKRPSTVKRPPSKFRSTGLEEEPAPSAKLPKNADLSKPIPKRTGSDIKSELPNKRSRLHMPPPLSVPTATTTMTTPTSTSPTSPGDVHGKIKLIPARPKPKPEIQESSGFMDSLETSSRTAYGGVKKKRRTSGATPPGGANKPGTVPSTPPSPLSPTTAIARSLPSVPSFYKDTQQEVESTPEKEIKKERSPSPVETKEDTPVMDVTAIKQEPGLEQAETREQEKERSVSPTDSMSSKGLLTTGATKIKKKKKSVTWKEEHNLKEVFYFELDEDERVNVNRPKDFNQAKKDEMMFDRRAVESVRRKAHDTMTEQIAWYRPKVVLGHKEFEYGKESKERAIQKVREQGVLQALFFNKNMIPDNPIEPDFSSEDHEESKMIPLEDVSGGDQMLFNYDSHPKAVVGPGKPSSGPPDIKPKLGNNMKHSPSMPPMGNLGGPPMGPPMGGPGGPPPGAPIGQMMPPNNPPNMGPPGGPPNPQGGPPQGLNLPPNLNLPPDLANILSQFQNASQNQNDPVMNQLQQIVNNLMCGGSEQSYDQLQQIQQFMSSQMGIPPEALMNSFPPGMPPPGMGPMGMRAPLLGSAPPGFMPQRQMGPGPPNRFGPPGPQGNWGGPQGNQGGGGNYGGGGGGGGGPRMRGQWQGGGGNHGNWGGRYSGNRRECRHFKTGACKLGKNCYFLHPGINGPNDDEDINY